MISVFLCRSSKDKFFARKLAETLSSYDVKMWIDEAELRVEKKPPRETSRAA